MECTQRIECHSISKDAENNKKEIGCLSIKGIDYPLKNGHNIIGRDPQRCNVLIDLCSISKTHAMIISKGDRVTVMDMNSTNKTFLLREPDKHLDPWEHYPIHNGELLQFGNVYATLKLHECEIDLPATQALNLPITSPLVCEAKTTKPTTIPESPDFSDRDDSYIVASQSEKETPVKSKCQFIKPCNKMKPIQPVGTNKIDNIYWNSSRRSNSLNISSDNVSSHNIPVLPSPQNNIDDIYDLETQNHIKPFYSQSKNSNYSGNTELSSPSILKPPETESVDDIYDLQTQLLKPKEPVVPVTETINIHEMQTQCLIPYEGGVPDVHEPLDIHEMETQMNLPKVQKIKIQHEMQLDLSISNEKKNDTIVNGEIQQIDQPSPHTDTGRTLELSKSYEKSEGIARKSNNLTYHEKENHDLIDMEHYHQNLADNISLKNCKKDDKQKKSSSSNHELLQKSKETDIWEENANESNCVPFEEMCTQVLYENTVEHPKDTLENNNLYSEEIVTPFKIPRIFNAKKKDVLDEKSRAVFSLVNARDAKEMKCLELEGDENEDLPVADMYYDHTQDLLEDLCSPKSPSPDKNNKADSKVLQCSSNSIIINKSQVISPGNNSSISDEGKGVITFISNLPGQDIQNTTGPDIDVTPKKLRPTFSDSELPLSQELKTRQQKPTDVIDTFVDSDTECLEDPSTPVLFRPKNNQKLDAKKGLPQSLDVDGLPSRIMLRNVKPTSKFLETFGNANLLQRELFQEPTCELDAQLLNVNIIALKNVSEKKKVCTDSKKHVQENNSTTRNKVEINEKGQREKGKVSNSNKINSSKTYHDDHTNKNVNRINTKTYTKGNTSKIKGQLNEDSENKKRDSNAKKRSDIVTPDKDVRITKNKDSKNGIKKEVIDSKLTKTNEATKKDKDDTVIKPSSNKIKGKDKKEDNTAESTGSDSISGRITRSSKQRKNIEIKKEEEQRQSSSKEENTSKRLRRKDTVRKSSPSPVRRSKRQKTINQLEPVKELKSILKVVSSNEHSYENKKSIEKASVVSSKRSIETNNNVSSSGLKRSIENDNEAPYKRTRTAISNSSLRHTSRGLRTQYVLFTGFPSDEVQYKLLKLGAKIVTNVKECTVVLTLQLKRTLKLLCAVGLGKPIVGPNWVQACVDTNLIIDPWLYLLKDEAVERRFQFSLEGTLKGNRNYLSGYNIYATPNVLPPAVEMKQIVECSGGNWCEDSSSSANCICISCKADSHLWPTIRSKCRAIVTTEFVLAGVLRQKVDFNKYSIK